MVFVKVSAGGGVGVGVRELTNNNLPELYHFSRIFKTQINAD
jgi:hypothetical protein